MTTCAYCEDEIKCDLIHVTKVIFGNTTYYCHNDCYTQFLFKGFKDFEEMRQFEESE